MHIFDIITFLFTEFRIFVMPMNVLINDIFNLWECSDFDPIETLTFFDKLKNLSTNKLFKQFPLRDIDWMIICCPNKAWYNWYRYRQP